MVGLRTKVKLEGRAWRERPEGIIIETGVAHGGGRLGEGRKGGLLEARMLLEPGHIIEDGEEEERRSKVPRSTSRLRALSISGAELCHSDW